MTIYDLMRRHIELGKWPKVKCDHTPKHATSNIGTVQVIRPTGIGVRFPGQNWDKWFWLEDQKDGRTCHMGQLKLL